MDTTQDNLNAAANTTNEAAIELKHDAVDAAHAVEDKAKETAHDVQGRI